MTIFVISRLAKYVRFASEMSGLRIGNFNFFFLISKKINVLLEPGSLDLVHDAETNRWTCVLKLSHLGAEGNIAYMIRSNVPNLLKFKVSGKKAKIKLKLHRDRLEAY